MSKKRVVYSTDQGNLCPDCRQPLASCRCNDQAPVAAGAVRIHRHSKGRAGKPVSIVTNLPLAASDLKALAKELKQQCGVGGSVEGSDILIQGDKREQIKALLEAKGFTVKLAGG